MIEDKNKLPELPKGWVWTRLGEIAEINPKFLENNLNDSMEVSFLPMKAVEERTGKVDLSHIRKVSEVKKGYTSFRDGDILFAKITPCMENGKIAVVNNLKNSIGFGSTEFHVIHLGNPIDKKLLLFFLLQDDYRKTAQRSMTGSAGQLRVPVYFIENTAFPLPPLQEQQRIVAKIEELFTGLDAGVEALKKAKTQLKRYRQAVLKHAFEGKFTEEWRKTHKDEIEPASALLERIKEEQKENAKGKYKELLPIDASDLPKLSEGWTLTKLGFCCSVITKGESPNWQGFDYVDDGVTFIRSENVLEGRLDLSKQVKIPVEFHNKLIRSQIKPQDVLYNIVGASIGRCAFVPPTINEANVNQAVALIRTNKALFPNFLMYLLNSTKYKETMLRKRVEVARPNVSLSDLTNFIIVLPPPAEQHKIVEEIERCMSVADEVEKTVEQGLKQAERLRQSILKRAFEGKLVPQDPCDEPASVLLEKIKLRRQQTEQRTKTRRRKASG